MFALPQPPLSVRTNHNFQNILQFFQLKVWTTASEEPFFSAMDNPLTADVFYGQPPTLSLIPVSH